MNMTDNKRPQVVPRLLLTITKEEDQRKLEELFDSINVPVCFQFRGKGTATSEMMDIFGMRGTTRLLSGAVLPKSQVKTVFEMLYKQLHFRHKGGGIAITIPLNALQNHILQVLDEEERAWTEIEASKKEMPKGEEEQMGEKAEYTVIWVSVDGGYSDDVVDAARNAGAKGGTVMKGRRRNSKSVSRHFGIKVQEEQDFVMIVVPKERKTEIMTAIASVCGLGTEAHGVVLALPVEDVMGLTH